MNAYLKCNYIKIGTETVQEFNFKTKRTIITKSLNLENVWVDITNKLRQEMVDFEVRGSGWTMLSLNTLELRYSVYQPIKGSSYIPLPHFVKKTRSVINFFNKNIFCFMYALLSKYVKRIYSEKSFHPYKTLYNWNGIKWPMTVDDIDHFEKLNPNTSIHVYFINDDLHIEPFRLSKIVKEDHFNLLLLMDNNKYHFTYIQNFEKLISPQLPLSYRRIKKKIVVCKRCILPFFTEKSLRFHKCPSKKMKANVSINNTIPLKFKLNKSLFILE